MARYRAGIETRRRILEATRTLLAELGLPKQQIGFLLSLFPFCGLLALGFAPTAARFGRKRVYVVCYGIRKPVMGLLPDNEAFSALLSSLGVNKKSLIVAYDDEGGGIGRCTKK